MLRGGAALAAALALPAVASTPAWGAPRRRPDSLPFPKLPEGTDTLPQIEHVIIADDGEPLLRQLLRRARPRRRLPARRDGRADGLQSRTATATCIHAFHMPSTPASSTASPSQNVEREPHLARHDGRNDGFVLASGPVAMGYWTRDDIPFYYGLARTFPLCRSLVRLAPCQTYPEPPLPDGRTAAGHHHDTSAEALTAPPPPNGNIFERLDAHGISWRNYDTDLPGVAALPRTVYARTRDKRARRSPSSTPMPRPGRCRRSSLVDPGVPRRRDRRRTRPTSASARAFAAQVINAVDGRSRLAEDAARCGCTTSTAATTTTCRRRARSRPTTSRPRSRCRPTSPAATIATASACRR